ncbi:ATP-binding protein [Reichenbachiella ulvae]|uniref:histidine kinase n=1 Tax=Reichenbachiella ulvae TaxID=2980104 RepID=A0ABT3CWC9_9BACT|nr:ATP-binding protein [Reichenbachiella ulvae]MCV9388016.1 ATP-binding protein [Reichenbachiella ulvae]
MKRCILLLFFLSSFSTAFSQSTWIDSLRNASNSLPNSSEKVDALNHLVFELSYGDKHEALEKLRESIRLSQELDYQKGLNRAYQILGIIYLDKGELDSAEIYFHKALGYFEKTQDKAELFKIYQKLGQVQSSRNSFQLAGDYYEREMQIARSLGDTIMLGNAYNDRAALLIEQGWHAIERSDSSIYQQYFEEAIPLIYRAIDEFRKAGYDKGVALAYANLALLQDELNEPDASIHSMKAALQYFEEMNYKVYMVSAYNHLNKVMQGQQDYDSALYYVNLSLELSKEIESKVDLRNAYGQLSQLYEAMAHYEMALKYHREYDLLNDEIFSEGKQETIEKLEMQFQSRKQLDEIAFREVENKNQRYIIFLAAILVILMMISTFIFWRKNLSKKRFNLQLSKQSAQLRKSHDLIAQKNAEITESYNEQKNLMAIVAHDLRSPLNNVKALMVLMKDSGPLNEEQDMLLSKAFQVLEGGDSLISDMVNLSRFESGTNINLEDIHLNSLIAEILEIHTSYAERKSISFEMHANDNEIYLESDQVNLSRIMDNLISNAIKFSPYNSKIKVVLFEATDEVTISVIDQGPGLSEDDIANAFKRFKKLSAQPTGGENSTGLGLSIVKTLVEKIQGKISIESRLGRGASFHIRLKKKLSISKEQ